MTAPLTRRTVLGAGVAWCASPSARGQAAPPGSRPLVIGVPPFLSPGAMLSAFRPLRQHLEAQLKLGIELYTARDFRELVEQARRGDYDITLLPAHVAGLALNDWGFQGLAATVESTPVLILVRQGSTIKVPADLRGKRVGMLGNLSLTAAVGTLWLRQQQLEPGRDVGLVIQPSMNSALISLDRGDVEAITVTRSQLNLMPPGAAAAPTVLAELSDIPAPMYLARPDTKAADVAQFKRVLHSFAPDEHAPQTVVNIRLHEINRADLQRVLRYREVARQQLEAAGLSRG